YRNARHHDKLTRGGALSIFREISVAGGLSGPWHDAFEWVTSEARPLLSQLAAVGAPVPGIGVEVGDGWLVEILWQDAKVAVVTDEDSDRDVWLSENGFHCVALERASAAELSARLKI
ncbi:MAG: hypothetical protein GX610_06685, partial [Rhodococcus sp.]|nr:hypothetical protein [Rhodococcus sp. (in: high G+C Gram-positive bacteria)]